MDIALWILFAVSAALYWWVGKVFVSQPKFNHPQLFWNPALAKTLVTAPLLGFGAVVIGGFVLTTSGWWFLGSVVAAYLILRVRPAAF